jgi:hypothetical protein
MLERLGILYHFRHSHHSCDVGTAVTDENANSKFFTHETFLTRTQTGCLSNVLSLLEYWSVGVMD